MMDAEQISMFALVEQYETEQLPPAERKKDVKAWTIQVQGITNSFRQDAPILYCIVRPVRIIFERDSRWDSHYQKWDTFGHSLGGRYWGWYGGHGRMTVFRRKPTHGDCFLYARQWKEYVPGTEIRYQGADAAATLRGECDKYI